MQSMLRKTSSERLICLDQTDSFINFFRLDFDLESPDFPLDLSCC